MNIIILKGRLTKDVEIRTGNGVTVGRFSIAVDRPKLKNSEESSADFINCVVFDQRAEFVSKYFHKGDMILVNGALRTGSYVNKDNQRVYTTDVNVTNIEFCGGKNSSGTSTPTSRHDSFAAASRHDSFDEEIPF